MKKFVLILLIGVLVAACTSNTIIKKPDNLIPKDQMVDLITDLMLAEGGKNIRNLDLERKTNFYPFVFEKYNIDSTQFQESNFYYTSRIDDYDAILLAVETRLNNLKDTYNAQRKLEDSIKRHKMDSLKTKNYPRHKGNNKADLNEVDDD